MGDCRIVRRAMEAGIPVESDVAVAEWSCQNVMMTVKGNTWATYKSEHRASITDPDVRKAVASVYSEKGRLPDGMRRKRVPSDRRKRLSIEQEECLFDELRTPAYKTWGKSARVWYRATRLIGVRPGEWTSGRHVWVNGVESIRVKNAKLIEREVAVDKAGKLRVTKKNPQEYRNIPISHLDETDKQVILYQLMSATQTAAKGQDVYQAYYAGVRKTLERASMRVFPGEPKVSLYTGRHVFADRFKQQLRADGVPERSIDLLTAAVMGHGSVQTQSGYGIGEEDENMVRNATMALEGLKGVYELMLRHSLSEVDVS